jgi:acyl carrier protein
MDGTQNVNGTAVEADVERFIRQNFFYDGPPLAGVASLMESGILDSTGVLELVAFIEETYGIAVADTDLTPENLDSLPRIRKFVESKRSHGG